MAADFDHARQCCLAFNNIESLTALAVLLDRLAEISRAVNVPVSGALVKALFVFQNFDLQFRHFLSFAPELSGCFQFDPFP